LLTVKELLRFVLWSQDSKLSIALRRQSSKDEEQYSSTLAFELFDAIHRNTVCGECTGNGMSEFIYLGSKQNITGAAEKLHTTLGTALNFSCNRDHYVIMQTNVK